jgi:hypothetical protein
MGRMKKETNHLADLVHHEALPVDRHSHVLHPIPHKRLPALPSASTAHVGRVWKETKNKDETLKDVMYRKALGSLKAFCCEDEGRRAGDGDRQRTSTYAAGEVVEVVRANVLCQHPADVREGLGRDAERPTGELG